jgi:hypothetical protein
MNIDILDSVYIVWEGNIGTIPRGVLFKRNAITFDPSISLQRTFGHSTTPAVAASGNNVYVVWSDRSTGDTKIFYTRSTDGGVSFGDIVNISNSLEHPVNPAVAASNNLT